MDISITLPAKISSGHAQRERHKPMAPLVSLNSFVLGFLVGCVLIYLVGFTSNDVCIGNSCSATVDKDRLDVPLSPLHKARRAEDIHNKKERHRRHGSERNSTAARRSQCPDRPLHVVILVLASPNGIMRRNTIRGSWMHDYSSKRVRVTSKFLLGTLDLGPEKMTSLNQESQQYGDLLLFENLKDSYYNLSLKVLSGLNWVERELSHFDFLIKTDDDSFIRLEKVTQAYMDMGCPDNLYWGYFNGHGYPEPVGKWAEKNWHICPHYLPYAMGGGYVFSRRVVRTLAHLSDRLNLYNNEDVTVGSWLGPFNLIRIHDMRFNVESLNHGCNNRYIITHKDTTRDMHDKFKNLRTNHTLCNQEKEIRPGFLYDWTVSPVDCCNRTKGLDIQQSVYNGRLLDMTHLPRLKLNYSQTF